MYYRVDAFGFLAHPAFANDSTLGDMNTGIQDQTEALRWVQQNIAAFGGDPSRVTIDGQSAGASSVEIHLVAPQQEGLFHQAIAQSVYRTPLPTPEQQEVSQHDLCHIPAVNIRRYSHCLISLQRPRAAVLVLSRRLWHVCETLAYIHLRTLRTRLRK